MSYTKPLTRKRTIELQCDTPIAFNKVRLHLQDKYVLISKVYSFATGIGIFTVSY
jgi:hypothetical protein